MKIWQILCFLFFFSIYVSFVSLQYVNSLATSSVLVEVRFEPEVLNLKSEGAWVTCFLQVITEGYGVGDINVSSVRLFDVIPVDWSKIQGKRLMVKFDRGQLIALLKEILPPEPYVKFKYVDLKVAGEFFDGAIFTSYDRVKVIFL